MAAAFMNLPSDLKRTALAIEALREAIEALPRGQMPTDAGARAELAAVAKGAEAEMLAALDEAESLIRTLEH